MLKELFPGSTVFTGAIFKIPQISNHFSAMLGGSVVKLKPALVFSPRVKKLSLRIYHVGYNAT